MIRRPALPILAAALLVCASVLTAVAALAAPTPQTALPAGTVLALSGTPHLWIADERGTIHWGGDTRALTTRFVNWSDRREVSVTQLRSFPLGDPWLSAGLLKLGDPIYLVKWETSEARPTLLHVQSIADVELFGINATNYGAFVLERIPFEMRYGFNVDALTRGTLAPAVDVATATPTAAPASATATPAGMVAKLAKRTYDDLGGTPPTYVIHTTVELTGAPPRTRIKVSARVDEYVCSPSCEPGKKSTWGPTDAGDTNADGYLKFEDHHGPYSDYTYTFTAPNGQTASVRIDNDFVIIS